MTELERYMELGQSLADISHALCAEAWRGDIEVSYKDDGSSLTKTDLAIEARWREEIRRQFPTHGILGEEHGADVGSSAFTWVLDPVDGTRQFGAGLLNFSSLISLCRDDRPILGIIDTAVPQARFVAAEGQGTFFAGRPIRSSGQKNLADAVVSLANPDSFKGAQSDGFSRMAAQGRARVFDGGSIAYGALARGLVDVCLNGNDLDPYDICALCPVVTEAGGTISDWKGSSLSLASRGAIAASASEKLHSVVLDRL